MDQSCVGAIYHTVLRLTRILNTKVLCKSCAVECLAGKSHSCAIDSDGLVVCWGRNSRKGETKPPEGVRFKQISASLDDHNCGIEDSEEETQHGKSAGRVRCWGNDRLRQSTPPEGEFYSVTTGRSYSCGIQAPSREIKCWGKLRGVFLCRSSTTGIST